MSERRKQLLEIGKDRWENFWEEAEVEAIKKIHAG